MTNRIEYPTPPPAWPTREGDIQAIKDRLTETKQALTLENATDILTQCLTRCPEAWVVTIEDLPALWVKFVEKAV